MILVTGGAGYVGSHFVRTFLMKNPNDEIVIVDNLVTGNRESIPSSPRVHFVEANIGDTEAMHKVFSDGDISAVVHFAASAYVGESQQNPTKYFHNNVANALAMFGVMDEHNVNRVIFSSTCAVYGDPQYTPMDEKHHKVPVNVYGQTKLMVEQTLSLYAATKNWTCIALRYFNAAGADASGEIGECHEPESHLIPLVLQAALKKRDAITVNGDDYDTRDGTCIRDYIHVTDLAEAHCSALKLLEKESGFHAVNLGTGTGASVREIIDICAEITGQRIPQRLGPRREGDPPVLVANGEYAKERLAFEAKHSLADIIKSAWQWEQSRRY